MTPGFELLSFEMLNPDHMTVTLHNLFAPRLPVAGAFVLLEARLQLLHLLLALPTGKWCRKTDFYTPPPPPGAGGV